MELMNRIKKNKKGFTLVEIIVVLVILAILAAFTIPTMLGFVGDARGKAMIAEAREVYVAAQSTATQYSATDALTDGQLSTALGSVQAYKPTPGASDANGGAAADSASKQMKKYLGTDLGIVDVTGASSTGPVFVVTVGGTDAAGLAAKTAQVKSVKYTKDKYEVTISGNSATVVKIP